MSIQVVAPSPSSSSHTITGESKYRYDVFLSFRGKDTRDPFTVPLYNALRRKGINAFIDDRKLGKGKRIAPALLKAIERSRISIIVFSSDYATSTWCLVELAHIVQCKNEKNQVVMPIFYKVDPVAVQYQKDSFEEAMADHENRFREEPKRVQNWRYALSEAASLTKEWLFKDEPGFDQGVFIERIVEHVFVRLPPKQFQNTHHMVGLEPRIKEVMSLLNETDRTVCMLGIYGAGGIGKTTLAKAVYNSILAQFEGSCFLFDVKEASKKYQGVVRLQQTLLSEILDKERIKMFWSVDEGISRIKHRLSHKNVLLVLDDVDEIEQLEQLAGGCDWFGKGSKVIITTRNRQLLIACNVEKTYEMEKLDEHDSVELFCRHTFHRNQPLRDYQDLSHCAISYANGLPLALRVIGSNLKDKNLEEWRSILEQYERIPERTIHDVLKISYDCLQNGAKRIFLDIACFFIHGDKIWGSVGKIVEVFGLSAQYYLEVLIDKSMITVDDYEDLYLHDLIRQMGREIVRQEAPLNPEKRSRLWFYKDILKVLHENLGCNNIEGIMLNPPQQEKVEWSGVAFEKMNNLKILVVRNVQFSTSPAYIPNGLRWLEWEEYPSATLPTDFCPLKLDTLKLPKSSFILREPFQSFTSYVTNMDFSHCEFITEVPDVSQWQSLKRLNLSFCSNLIKVDDSVGYLSKLVELDVACCEKLSIFPREIKMPSLQSFDLYKCTSLEYFPRVVGDMDALESIFMNWSAIKEIPPSVGNLSRLRYLSMESCESLGELPTSLFTLPNLYGLNLRLVHRSSRKSLMKLMQDQPSISSFCHITNLFLSECGLLDEELHLILSCSRNLRELHISRNDFVSLPKCIKQCAQLQYLNVTYCRKLRDIPELPSNLCDIAARDCISLTAESLESLYSQAKKELSDLSIVMATKKKFPEWFHYSCKGATLRFLARRNLPQAAFAFKLRNPIYRGSASYGFDISVSINGRKVVLDYQNVLPDRDFVAEGHVLLVDWFTQLRRQRKELNALEGLDWNVVEIQLTSHALDSCIARWGVYVYKNQTSMKDVRFPCKKNKRKDVRFKSLLSLKRRAKASPPNEPPNKFMRTDQGKLSNTKKGSRKIKRHSFYGRKTVFPMGKHVWRFMCNWVSCNC